ncbi:hypothetical protein [Paenibacillus silviterrae]|uniref:hypothetical protein n=1 Tax=Paenibacillus silviterrae TaxID=3242194 RepID=UPI0025430056|nr:hypothetical protein [Paenibacillus chinjuensis]
MKKHHPMRWCFLHAFFNRTFLECLIDIWALWLIDEYRVFDGTDPRFSLPNGSNYLYE